MNVVIMAGGSGTRFWPLSREKRPKQFLDIIGDRPMIFQTYERIRPLASDKDIYVVVGQNHEEETRKIFSSTGVSIVVEPFGRNTAPCIGLAALIISSHDQDEPVVILPADHYIVKPDVFRQDILKALKVASEEDCIVTLGILPTRPETGYGYIEREERDLGVPGLYRVKMFVEKPDIETAKRYLESGRFFWNAGIFIAKPSVLLKEFEKYMPSFYRGLLELKAHIGKPSFDRVLRRVYEDVENISFDYAIMEKTDRPVYVVASDCGWSDVGSWYSLYELRAVDEASKEGNVVDGDGAFFHSRRCFVMNRSGRWIALLGLEGVLVVDTPDALLVARLEDHQKVREITDFLKREGMDHLR
ncbi:mannose-1-phosphate guanylyltransferase [Thermodesulforhabdus norvegica]|uniref:mannose-1-phosphate guanylyltransferase n=1 Tax=Thermodesulforhabdus norvegica TaxID=39841 RepID=A0A1I4W258_9BACT|nr:mannose-1-phosphate guanylyltransferase [Thermodesulforhabdus norvegica]SFN07572.1 mannose-1-phosphate guanylyltransferase [Thermodesulforhabdus norvegica]